MKLEITEWQRVYLAECIIQSEIEDKETWLEVMKDADEKEADYLVCHRLDALRKLKAFLGGCGKEEERKPLPWKAAAKKYMELLQEQEADRQMLVNASLWARAWKERAKNYKNESNVNLETAREFARYYEKACEELNAHGLLQDFLDRIFKEEGGEA